MDYGTLAQLSSPGQTPLTSGVVDPVGYQRWMNLSDMQQQALQRAMPLAEMNSEQQALQHEAFKAAQPARMNQSTLANMTTASAIDNQPGEAELKKNTTQALNEEQKRKMADVLAPLSQFADAMDAAKTPEEQEQIWKAIDMQGITLPNGYALSSKDREMGTALLKASRNARENTPAFAVKKDIAAQSNEVKLSIAALKEAGLDARLSKNLSVKETIARIKASEAAKPLNEGQGLIRTLDAQYSPNSPEWLQAYTVAKSYAATIKPDQAAGTANSMLSGKGIQVPSVAPAQFPAPTQTAPADTLKHKPMTDGDVSKLQVNGVLDFVTKDGKKISGKILGINRKTGQANIEGHGVVELK